MCPLLQKLQQMKSGGIIAVTWRSGSSMGRNLLNSTSKRKRFVFLLNSIRGCPGRQKLYWKSADAISLTPCKAHLPATSDGVAFHLQLWCSSLQLLTYSQSKLPLESQKHVHIRMQRQTAPCTQPARGYLLDCAIRLPTHFCGAFVSMVSVHFLIQWPYNMCMWITGGKQYSKLILQSQALLPEMPGRLWCPVFTSGYSYHVAGCQPLMISVKRHPRWFLCWIMAFVLTYWFYSVRIFSRYSSQEISPPSLIGVLCVECQEPNFSC